MTRSSFWVLSVCIIVLLVLVQFIYAAPQQVIRITSAEDASLYSFNKLKGVNFVFSNLERETYGTTTAIGKLKYLRTEVGADWVAFGAPGFQKELNESQIRERSGYITHLGERYKYRTLSIDFTDIPKMDELLVRGITDSHRLGLKVMLKPYATIDTFWNPTVITKKPMPREQQIMAERLGYVSVDFNTYLKPQTPEKRYYDALKLYLATLYAAGLQLDPSVLGTTSQYKTMQYKYQVRFKKLLEKEKPVPKKWEDWFTNYKDYIIHYARIAQQNNVELFVIGDSLWPASDNEAQWRDLIKAVREVYKGKITYAADRDEYQKIKFWDALDFIGINAYFRIGTREQRAQLTNYRQGWETAAERVEALSKKFNKPVIFTEIGAPSIYLAGYFALRPMDDPALARQEVPAASTDNDAQRDYYESFFQVFRGKEWLKGVFWWGYYSSTNDYYRSSYNIEFSPYLRPAEGILKKYYLAGQYYRAVGASGATIIASKPPYLTTPRAHEGPSNVYYSRESGVSLPGTEVNRVYIEK